MNARNGMQAMRVRAVTTLKITAVAAVLSFTAPFVGTTAPVSAHVTGRAKLQRSGRRKWQGFGS